MQNKELENIDWKKDFYKNDVEALIIRFKQNFELKYQTLIRFSISSHPLILGAIT